MGRPKTPVIEKPAEIIPKPEDTNMAKRVAELNSRINAYREESVLTRDETFGKNLRIERES